ncbi:hypothetical protein INR49_017074 [Caranx melampygus]|nr:hypothetical protein INR49_017074 [Caranx melampygus]
MQAENRIYWCCRKSVSDPPLPAAHLAAWWWVIRKYLKSNELCICLPSSSVFTDLHTNKMLFDR